MYNTPAHEICDNLGFTPEEARVSAENVASRIDRLDNWDEHTTSALLAGQQRVHLHQLAIDSTDEKWLIVGINDDTIELTRVVEPTESDRIGFMEEKTMSHGRFLIKYEPMTESISDSRFDRTEEVPVWGY